MNYDNLSEIIKQAASTENTPELKVYWQKRYEDLLNRNLFKISSKTLALLIDGEEVSKPATPFGDIVLVNHIDKNQSLDELTLQSTLESSVRLLDSLVDKIKFTQGAKHIVTQYRKIGLGLFDFKEYLNARKSMSDLDEIDYIGSLVSSGSYRASESLAEEKGVCANWDKISKHLRPKSFEYWYELDTGEVKSGLEVSQDFDQETIKLSNYEIIPRRNSNILLFPPELEWQIWSDRDSTAPKTEISQLEKADTEPAGIKKIEVQTTTPQSQKPNQQPEQHEISSMVSFQESIAQTFTVPQGVISEVNNEVEHSELKTSNQTLEISNDIENQNLEDMVSPGHEIVEESVEQSQIIPFNTTHEDIKENIENEIEEKINSPIPTEPAKVTSPDPLFQIGELVTVNSDSKPEYKDKVYQVIESILQDQTKEDKYHYKLTGDDLSIEETLWKESELIPVELIDILSKINHQIPHPQPIIQITETVTQTVHALMIEGDKILLENVDNVLELPGGKLPKNIVPEMAIEELMYEKYGIKGKSIYEIGTSVTKSSTELPSTLHLGYIFVADNHENSNLQWYEKKELAKANKYVLGILSKLEMQKKYFNSQPNSNKETQTHLNQQLQNFNINAIKNNLTMAKYILKLEQLLQTESFGKIKVSLEYDSKGARLVILNGDNLNTELKTLLGTVLNLVNFSLSKNTTPTELATLLSAQSQTPGSLSDLLEIVANVLKSAPGTVAEITPDMIVDTLPLQGFISQATKTEPKKIPSKPEQVQNVINMEDNPAFETPNTTKPEQPKGFFGSFKS